jgi:hypothetical protein
MEITPYLVLLSCRHWNLPGKHELNLQVRFSNGLKNKSIAGGKCTDVCPKIAKIMINWPVSLVTFSDKL